MPRKKIKNIQKKIGIGIILFQIFLVWSAIKLLLDTLLNFNYSGDEIKKGIEYLISEQLQNGSWKKDVAMTNQKATVFFGSDELTTAIVLEALYKYKNSLSKNVLKNE